jgi:hypothetical protein
MMAKSQRRERCRMGSKVFDHRPGREKINRRAARRALAARLAWLGKKIEDGTASGGVLSYLDDERHATRYALYLIDQDIADTDESVREAELPNE